MFWVGLATLIMLISGTGDDTRAFRKRVKEMEKVITELITEPARRDTALKTLTETQVALSAHRTRLAEMGTCLEAADRNYAATEADYNSCVDQLDAGWDVATDQLLTANKRFHSLLDAAEWQTIQDRLSHKP